MTALAVVRRDLDATGFGEFEFRAVCSDDWSTDVRPRYRTALPEGWDHNAGELDPAAGFTDLLCDAGHAVSETLAELRRLAWPECREHNGPQLAARPRSLGDADTPRAWWWCATGDHFVAAVGHLRAHHVRAQPPRYP